MTYVPHLMSSFLELMHPIAFSPFAGFWVWLKPRGLDALLALAAPPALKQWEGFVQKCLDDRTRQEEKSDAKMDQRKDIFHWLYHAEDPETGARGYPLIELYGEIELMIIAGSDTTATVLSALFFYLGRFPAAKRRLAAEIRAAFESYDEIHASKLFGCKYLCAFVQEGLRMAPPVPAEPAREVQPGGTVVDGLFIPAGMRVSTGLYCMSYNKDIYPEPFRFRPERWIVGEDGSTEESVEKSKEAQCAFLFGSRGCVGKNLAWMEMLLVVAKLVWNFEVQQDPANNLGGGKPDGQFGKTEVNHYQTRDAFVSLREGPMLQFKRRS
jgi:cytochrome P450